MGFSGRLLLAALAIALIWMGINGNFTKEKPQAKQPEPVVEQQQPPVDQYWKEVDSFQDPGLNSVRTYVDSQGHVIVTYSKGGITQLK